MALGGHNHRKSKGIDNQDDHYRVAAQAAQFLDAQVKDIGEAHTQCSCFLRKNGGQANEHRDGDNQGNKRRRTGLADERALLKVPRIMVRKYVVG